VALFLRGVGGHGAFERRQLTLDVDQHVRVAGMIDFVEPHLEIARDRLERVPRAHRTEHPVEGPEGRLMVLRRLER
jgi:hypothetical protein